MPLRVRTSIYSNDATLCHSPLTSSTYPSPISRAPTSQSLLNLAPCIRYLIYSLWLMGVVARRPAWHDDLGCEEPRRPQAAAHPHGQALLRVSTLILFSSLNSLNTCAHSATSLGGIIRYIWLRDGGILIRTSCPQSHFSRRW